MSEESNMRRNGWLMILLGWSLAFFMVTAFYRMVILNQQNPNRVSVISSQDGALVLEENSGGHYLVEGTLNDELVTFLVDTGATQVAVPEAAAARAGLQKGARLRINTAAGVATVWATQIDELQIGFLLFRDLSGVIVPDLHADTVLLGMNALGQLHITQSDGTLTLRPIADK